MQSFLRINGGATNTLRFLAKKWAKNGTILLEPEAMPPHCVCAAALLKHLSRFELRAWEITLMKVRGSPLIIPLDHGSGGSGSGCLPPGEGGRKAVTDLDT